MGHHQIIRLLGLIVSAVMLSACQHWLSRGELKAYQFYYKPGEQLIASYEKTDKKHTCAEKPSLFLVDTLFRPSTMVPSEQILNRFEYVCCATRSIRGSIVRQVMYEGRAILEDVSQHTFVPGTWAVNAYLKIPAEAKPGAYVFVLTVSADDNSIKKVFPFQIIEP